MIYFEFWIPAGENGYQEKDNVDKSEQPKEQNIDDQSVAKEASVLEGGDGQEKAQENVACSDEEQLATGDKQSGENEQLSGENAKPNNENDEDAAKEEYQTPFDNVTQNDSGTISRKIDVPNNKVICHSTFMSGNYFSELMMALPFLYVEVFGHFLLKYYTF